jgi:hypothetical protein
VIGRTLAHDRVSAAIGSYRHLPNLQLPEQHWLLFVQLENLGLHETQPLVSYRHVDALQRSVSGSVRASSRGRPGASGEPPGP